jgi:hypothetical protein
MRCKARGSTPPRGVASAAFAPAKFFGVWRRYGVHGVLQPGLERGIDGIEMVEVERRSFWWELRFRRGRVAGFIGWHVGWFDFGLLDF